MKTDVIFLGAGASLSAGFPTNEGLANYIIYKLPNRIWIEIERNDANLRKRWWELAELFRETGYFSVDAFCEKANQRQDVVRDMKQMLRLALFDHSKNWWAPETEYRRLIDTLFLPGR